MSASLLAASAKTGVLGMIYLGAVGFGMIVMGLVILYRRICLFAFGVRARGFFKGWESRGVNRTYYYGKIEFVATDGKPYSILTGAGSSDMKERSVYNVYYRISEPAKGMVYSFMDFWAAPLVFFIMAAGALFAASQQ